MKKVFCVAKQYDDTIYLYIYLLKMEDKGILNVFFQQRMKKNYKRNYEIVNEISLSFPYTKHITKDALRNYGNIILEKLKESSYDEAAIDIVFDLDGTFSSQFSLPKLRGKALMASYNSEIERQFGNLLDEYVVSSRKRINMNKGYTFDLLAVKEFYYKMMVEMFNSVKLKIENCTYLPSIFSNITNEEGIKNVGILIDEEKTYVFVAKKGILKEQRVIPIGYEAINESIMRKFSVEKKDVNRYRKENISKIELKRVIYQTMRKIIEQVYILLLSESDKADDVYVSELDKTYIYSIDGKTKELLLGFPLLLRKKFDVFNLETPYRYQIFIDAYYNNQKNLRCFPIKVKYEKK